ncbi:MAG: hypothetical protein ACI9BD_000013 [Candidatus Marinamargulisbacteria bacterium]|jgi:hypothetical protein
MIEHSHLLLNSEAATGEDLKYTIEYNSKFIRHRSYKNKAIEEIRFDRKFREFYLNDTLIQESNKKKVAGMLLDIIKQAFDQLEQNRALLFQDVDPY